MAQSGKKNPLKNSRIQFQMRITTKIMCQLPTEIFSVRRIAQLYRFSQNADEMTEVVNIVSNVLCGSDILHSYLPSPPPVFASVYNKSRWEREFRKWYDTTYG